MSGSTNRRKGHNFERELARLYREAGYKYAQTSRQASRLYDDCMLDFCYIPDNTQAKNVKASLNPLTIIRQMKKLVEEKLEPIEKRMQRPFVVIHKQNREITVYAQMSLDSYFRWKKLEADAEKDSSN